MGTLIFNLEHIYRQLEVSVILDEFIDLRELVDLEDTAAINTKYKLVAVCEILKIADNYEILKDENHGISYVIASKYANDIYLKERPRFNIARENLWYKVDDDEVELIPFSRVSKITGNVVLIYEQEQQSTQKEQEHTE